VLEYLNVPHDIELRDPKRLTLRAQVKNEDVAEGAPDRIVGEAETAQQSSASATVAHPETKLVPAVYSPPENSAAPATVVAPAPARGTIVLDAVGGIAIPDFHGKSLRACLEQAQAIGLELEVSGSGMAQSQSPAAGARIPPGGHVTVRFGR
jgi:stage V sporulation protein D (sporulation-specific penicillin-binding protein)